MLERNVFVSGHNVYASQEENAQNEDTLLLDPLNADVMAKMESYGADLSRRSGSWPWRFAHPSATDGAALVPDSATVAAVHLGIIART